MVVPDLAPYFDSGLQVAGEVLAIGWLDSNATFPVGGVSDEFTNRIRQLCEDSINRMRNGYHCRLCNGANYVGNGEVQIKSASGTIFIAPGMLFHYLDAHRYRPPQLFQDVVLSLDMSQRTPPKSRLAEAVRQFADQSTEINRDSVFREFQQNAVGVRVPFNLGSAIPGSYIVTGAGVPVRRVTTRSGERLIEVLTDVPYLSVIEPVATFLELAPDDVLKIAAQNEAGILIQVAIPNRNSWATISANDVAEMHNNSPSR